MGNDAAGVRSASTKLAEAATRRRAMAASRNALEEVERLQQSLAIAFERDRHNDRLLALAEVWCHFRGGEPNELIASLIGDV